MPRVHGIEIVPRRGRGRGRQLPSVAAIGGVGGSGANSCVAESASTGDGDGDGDGGGGGRGGSGGRFRFATDTLHVSLSQYPAGGVNDEIHCKSLEGGGRNGSSRYNYGDVTSPAAASPREPESVGKAKERTMPPEQTREAKHVAITADGMSIRPQAREILNHIEFGSHSFSVQEISRKTSPVFDSGTSRLGWIGSSELKLIGEMPPTLSAKKLAETTAQLMTSKDDEAKEARPLEELEEVATKDGQPGPTPLQRVHASQLHASKTDETMINKGNDAQMELPKSPGGGHCTDKHHHPAATSIYDCNAYWLYQRCSAACIQMESPLSPFELSIEILRFVRSSIEDDDKFEWKLSCKLFDVMKSGRRRDLDLIYDVTERLPDLREDTTLDESSIQEVATFVGGLTNTNKANEGNSVDKGENGHQAPITEPIEPSTVENIFRKSLDNIPLHKERQEDSPRKMHRSRRKKHPSTQNPSIAINTTLGGEVSSHTHANNLTDKKVPSAETNRDANEVIHADFPKMKDILDVQDDEKWSFLPSSQQQSIGESNEDMDQLSRRVTRSMDVAVGDDICVADNVEVHSPINERSLELSGMDGEAEMTEYSNDKKDRATYKNNEIAFVERAEEKQVNGLKAKDEIGLMQRKDRRSLGEAIVAISSCGIEHECEKPQASDVSYDVHDTPRGAEEPKIDCKEVFTLVKTRKRCEGKDTVRVIFTGFTATRRHMQMIETIGAEYVESIEEAHTATHVIATDGVTALRRTPKLMICICRVANILSIEWLEQSSKEQRILDTHDFLLLGDREAEKRYDFSMKETIRNGIQARKRRGGVLGGWFVYICSGVAGNRAPNMKEMQLIIEAGGGQVLKSLSNMNSFDPLKTIVLTSEPSTQSQLKEQGVAKVERLGAKILSTSWLFHTIITQKDVNIDSEDESDPANDGSQSSRLVRSNSHELLESPILGLSVSPGNRVALRSSPPTNIIDEQATIVRLNDVTPVRIRGSSVTHLQCAPPSSPRLKKRELNILPPQEFSKLATSRRHVYSHKNMMVLLEAISVSDDMAAAKTRKLWLDFFNRGGKDASTIPANRPKRGVRCLRGRKRSISPLVTSTNPIRMKAPTDAKNAKAKPIFVTDHERLIFEDNPFVTWEAYVLFILGLRAERLVSSTSATIVPACSFFPRPVAINSDESMKQGNYHDQALFSNKLSLKVDAQQFVEDESWEIFGSLQDVFSLHQQYQTSGMIPEQVVALLSLKAIEALAAMHSCGIVHNDIGLDSFLLVKRSNPSSSKKEIKHDSESEIGSWFLQVTGFGNKAVVLDCLAKHEDSDYAHDYQCLANVIHLFLTGGVEISLNTSRSGLVEFTSKVFIKGNLFLRGALSWCSLIDALMCVGELTPGCDESEGHFRLKYPVNVSNLTASDDGGDCRMNQFLWSCRILQDLSDGRKLDDFMNGLTSYNSRFIFQDTKLSSYVCNTHDGRQSFACYTSNTQTVHHLMERECKLQTGTLALVQREAELLDKVAQFEKSKLEHQSILKKMESEYRMKESELLKREKAHIQEVQWLETKKEDLNLRQRRLDQRLLLARDGVSKDSSAPPRATAMLKEQVHLNSSLGNETYSPAESQLLAGEETLKESNPSPRSTDSLPYQYAQSGESFLSPHDAARHKRKKNVDIQSLSQNQSHGDGDASQNDEDCHGESQEYHESASSMKKRKKGCVRKSPKCSLHNLPLSPTRKKQTPKRSSSILDSFDILPVYHSVLIP